MQSSINAVAPDTLRLILNLDLDAYKVASSEFHSTLVAFKTNQLVEAIHYLKSNTIFVESMLYIGMIRV